MTDLVVSLDPHVMDQYASARHICCRALGLDPSGPDDRDLAALQAAVLAMVTATTPEVDRTTTAQQIEDALADLRRLRNSLERLNPDALYRISRSDPAHVAIDMRCAFSLFAGERDRFARALNERFEVDARIPDYSLHPVTLELDKLERALSESRRFVRFGLQPGRRPHGAARRVAVFAAQLYFNVTGDRPTYRTDGRTKFSTMLEKLFETFGIKADTRRPAEFAIRAVRQNSTK